MSNKPTESKVTLDKICITIGSKELKRVLNETLEPKNVFPTVERVVERRNRHECVPQWQPPYPSGHLEITRRTTASL